MNKVYKSQKVTYKNEAWLVASDCYEISGKLYCVLSNQSGRLSIADLDELTLQNDVKVPIGANNIYIGLGAGFGESETYTLRIQAEAIGLLVSKMTEEQFEVVKEVLLSGTLNGIPLCTQTTNRYLHIFNNIWRTTCAR